MAKTPELFHNNEENHTELDLTKKSEYPKESIKCHQKNQKLFNYYYRKSKF